MEKGVSAVVIGSRANVAAGPFGEVATSLLTVAPKPVLVIPRTYVGPMNFQRVLVPLDRSRATSRGAEDLVKRLKESGALVIALHVFDSGSVPRFWDRPEYEAECWGAQFLEHHGVSSGTDLRLTSAPASAPQVLEMAEKERAELILLAWGQDLAPGRAETVRQVLAEAAAPVLLVPSKE
jgi:nucleotide-binding universal stress UspA family protein